MNVLLLFFALPVATILLSIVLQKVLCSPILVAITFFAVYLIITFAVFNESFLVYAIVYTILAYITAAITRFIRNFLQCQKDNCCEDDNDDEINDNCNCESVCNCLMERNCNRRNFFRRY